MAFCRTRRFPCLVVAVLALLAGALAAPSAASAGCRGAGAHPSEVKLRVIKRATDCLIDRERRQHGLWALQGDRRLTLAARRHSRSMARNDFFSHDSVDGRSAYDRVRATGYLSGALGWAVGENIAWGSHSWATPRHIVRSWMRSPGHRANILSRNHREIGIGVVRGAPVPGVGRAATYTTDFGSN